MVAHDHFQTTLKRDSLFSFSSLSEFMKSVKQRFTRRHNAREGRRGTVWESRYSSVLVEEEERALRTMAAYIDLNPVRAGMVPDPADYRWSGYAEAMAGKARARRGLVRIIGQMAWPRAISVEAKPWGEEAFPKGGGDAGPGILPGDFGIAGGGAEA
jgi:hypothetical protein